MSLASDGYNTATDDGLLPADSRTARRLANYGITPTQYGQLLKAQGGRCAICQTTSPGGNVRVWNIDHDHSCCPGAGSCGECVRGLLCTACNIGIGHFNDDPVRLAAAITYLTR